MAATIKGVTTLIFGCDTVTTVIMQSVDGENAGEITYVQDEDGDHAAFAIHSLGRREVSGEYMYKNADVATALGLALSTLTNACPGTGSLYVYSLGRKESNTGFMRGTFKAGGVDGITT